MMHGEVEEKVRDGFAEVVFIDEIKDLLGTEEWLQLKISPLVMVPHQSRKYRAILDLSLALKIFGMEVPLVNDNTIIATPQHSMSQLGQVLTQLIHSVAHVPKKNGNMVFFKLNIKDGYWHMIVQKGCRLNFVYVLPDKKGARIRFVISSALQMGWL